MTTAILLTFAAAVIVSAFAQTCPTLTVGDPTILTHPRGLKLYNKPDMFLGHYAKGDGSWLVAGAYGWRGWRGVALVYHNNGTHWNYHSALHPTTEKKSSYFGLSVHVCGETVIVGHPYIDYFGSRSGGAEIYQFNGTDWINTQTLKAPGNGHGHSSAYFGYATGCHKDTVVIGARYQNQVYNGRVYNTYTGAAYVYEKAAPGGQYDLKQILMNDERLSFWGDEVRVWISDEPDVKSRIVVGAPRAGPSTRGLTTVFEKQGAYYRKVQDLQVDDAPSGSHFGEGISVWKNTILQGGERAWNSFSTNGRNGGNVMAYAYSTWSNRFEELQYVEPNKKGGLRYGQRVHQHDRLAVVGAFGSFEKGQQSGSVFAHVQCDDGSWQLAEKLVPQDQENTSKIKFGKIVHADAHHIYVGAPDRANKKERQGAVYVYPYSLT